jgi:hypothetical protein
MIQGFCGDVSDRSIDLNQGILGSLHLIENGEEQGRLATSNVTDDHGKSS